MSNSFDYRTHILIGVRASGTMTVICHWSCLPLQAEVQQQIAGAKDTYVAFLLCTPTSIVRVNGADLPAAGFP